MSMKIGLVNLFPDETAPPMGLVYIATYLKQHGFNDVRIIDSTYDRNILSQIRKLDIVGISSMTPSYNKAIKLAQRIKSECNIPIIIGGVHISLVPKSLSREFAVGVIGEGEQVMLDLCTIFQQYGRFAPNNLCVVSGVAYWSEDDNIITTPMNQMENLDHIPMIDFTLLDERYFDRRWIDWIGRRGKVMHISTSRGCPYNCVFCSGRRFWQNTRFHSINKIFTEIKELITKYKVDHIVIDDDLFIANKNMLKELSTAMDNNNLTGKVAFLCSARANLIDDEMCEILKLLGVRSLNFGFESGSDKLLRYLKGGNVTVENNKNAIILCREYGFEISGNLIFGSPTENIDDMKKTVGFMKFAIKNGCYKVGAFILTPLPGTPLWKIALERGKVDDEVNWSSLGLYEYKNPLLLDPEIDLDKFKSLFKNARDISFQGWLRNRWWKILLWDSHRVFMKVMQDPMRAVAMLKNIFLPKAKSIIELRKKQ